MRRLDALAAMRPLVETLAVDLDRRGHRHLLRDACRRTAAARHAASSSVGAHRRRRRARRCRSPVSISAPKAIAHAYSLGRSTKKRASLVALPTRTMSRPVANGSSVPAWPTFLTSGRSARRTRATTSCEVQPLGLVDQEDAVEKRFASSVLSHAATSSGVATTVRPAASRWPPPPRSAATALTSNPCERRLTRDCSLVPCCLTSAATSHAVDAAQEVDDAFGLVLVGARLGVVGARRARRSAPARRGRRRGAPGRAPTSRRVGSVRVS